MGPPITLRTNAIVIGGADRAFSGGQLQLILPILNRHRVALWLPELDGPLDAGNPVHQALILMLGHDARREVQRARHRTLTAMRVLARDEGRFLGGRPPYGYRLVDAGPHPNRKHAQWGRRLKRLDPDPATAGHVRWIFAQRLNGFSAQQIAVLLTERGIPSPAASDPDRNAHRETPAWSRRAVDTILANPRYTGRQVFGRQRITHHEASPGGQHAGGPPTRGPNDRSDVVISKGLAHPALISEATFVAAQKVSAVAGPSDGGERRYLLTGLVICGSCGRRSEGAWVSGRAAYRCRHAQRGRRAADSELPFYAREDTLLSRAAAALDHLTGGGQTLWDTAAVADYLRARDLTVSSTRTGVTLLGTLPEKTAITIPGIFGVGQTSTLGMTANAHTATASPRKAAKPKTNRRKTRRITARLIKKDQQ
ncbi:recombinase family protein [Actinoplanes sp. CA-054009]